MTLAPDALRYRLLLARLAAAVEVLCEAHPCTSQVTVRASRSDLDDFVAAHRDGLFTLPSFPVPFGLSAALGLQPAEFLVQSDVPVEWMPGDFRPAHVEVFDVPLDDELYVRFELGMLARRDAPAVLADLLGVPRPSPTFETACALVDDGTALCRAFSLASALG